MPTGQETPIETCRRLLGIEGPLVACADETVRVLPGRPGTCERRGLEPLPPEYTAARARVVVLQRELAALEASADCVPLDTFAERAQGALDRLGWAGWRVQVRDDLGDGPCGAALALDGDGSRSIEGALLTDKRRLIVTPAPRRSTLDLIDGAGLRLMDASGERCFGVDDLERLARERLRGRALTFRTRSKLSDVEVMGPRGDRLAEGCAVIVGLAPTADDRAIVVEVWR